MEVGLTKNKILSELSRSPHRNLKEYVPIGTQAAKQEAEFFAHLIAWNHVRGQIRDSKVALPVVSLTVKDYPEEFVENSLAHLAMLKPKYLLKAYRFAQELKGSGRMNTVQRLVTAYLHEKEKNAPKWDRLAIQHRRTLKELYSTVHVKPATERANIVLYGRTFDKQVAPLPEGSIFQVVAMLKDMEPKEAASMIIKWKIPFLIAFGAMGAKAKDPDVLHALVNRMTPTEVITNTKNLKKWGMKLSPAVRGAFEQALERVSGSKANILKTTQAAEVLDDEDDVELAEKLRGVQEKQIKVLGGVDGNWLVLADRSGSMERTIDIARVVAATLAKLVKKKVWLVFFDTSPQTVDVTGLPLDTIKKATEHIRAGGGTSIGCGLQRMLDENVEIDGIAVVSDAQENSAPWFSDVYKRYSAKFDKQVPVYLYRTPNYSNFHADRDLANTMKVEGFDLQEFDLRGKVDYYSLPDLVKTMRVSRYSLIDEVMGTKLAKLSDVLRTADRLVVAHS